MPDVNCTTGNCDTALTNITAAPEPRLVLEKGAPGTAVAGTSVTYTLSLGNLGTGDLPAGTVILLDDQPPADSALVSAGTGSGVSDVCAMSVQT